MSRKSKTNRREHPARHADPRLALASADAFRACSRPFLQHVTAKTWQVNAVNQEAAKDVGGLVGSATNLALSVELYLKALWILHGSRVPETHHLWTLYKHLRPDLRSLIEDHYNTIPKRPDDEAIAFQFQIAPTGTVWAEDPPFVRDDSLPGVLKRSSDAFLTWRYFYEAGRPGRTVFLEYDFHFLGLVADVLRGYVQAGVEELDERRRRRKEAEGVSPKGQPHEGGSSPSGELPGVPEAVDRGIVPRD